MPSSEEIAGAGEALKGQVYDALRKVLGPKPTLRQAMVVKFTTLQIIFKMREMGEPASVEQDSWVEGILVLGEFEDGFRQVVCEIIAEILRTAPWGLKKEEGASSLTLVRTVNAVTDGVAAFARALDVELRKLEKAGVNLRDFDVEENDSEESDWEDELDEVPAPSKTKGKGKQPTEKPTKKSGTRGDGKTGHGNHSHAKAVPWTTPEHMGLLELYQKNPNRRTVSHPRISELHNARFWPNAKGRTSAAVSQQYLKLVDHDIDRIPGKMAELKDLLESEK